MIGNEYWNVDGNLWHKDIMTAYMTVASKCQLPYEKWTEIHWSEIAGQWQEPPVRDAHAPVYAHDFMDNPPKPNRYVIPPADQEAPPLYRPKDAVMDWLADYDISTRNQLETVLLFEDEDVEAIAITTMVYFPFPDVATVRVFVDGARDGIDLIGFDDVPDNLEHYASSAEFEYPCPELDPNVHPRFS